MKALRITVLFIICRLLWIWLDQCGSDLGFGEALPFCVECSGITTAIRLMMLALGSYVFIQILQERPEETQIRDDDTPPGRTYLIHWHRIALLLIILFYPVLIAWFDQNTTIPGPDALALTNDICSDTEFKGSIIWGLIVTFIVSSLKILHRK